MCQSFLESKPDLETRAVRLDGPDDVATREPRFIRLSFVYCKVEHM
jgi:hypothetical protein